MWCLLIIFSIELSPDMIMSFLLPPSLLLLLFLLWLLLLLHSSVHFRLARVMSFWSQSVRIPKHHAWETAENMSNITQHRTRLADSLTCRELGKGHLFEPRKPGCNRHSGDASWIRPLARGGHLQIHNWPFVILSKIPCFQISFMEEAPMIVTEVGQSQTHN